MTLAELFLKYDDKHKAICLDALEYKNFLIEYFSLQSCIVPIKLGYYHTGIGSFNVFHPLHGQVPVLLKDIKISPLEMLIQVLGETSGENTTSSKDGAKYDWRSTRVRP